MSPSYLVSYESGGAQRLKLRRALSLAGCCADAAWVVFAAAPVGVLDLADVQAFIGAFTTGESLADIAEPAGVLDLADVQAFVAAFVGGCP